MRVTVVLAGEVTVVAVGSGARFWIFAALWWPWPVW